MKIMERIVLGRTVYLLAAGAGLLLMGALYNIFGTEATFAPSLEQAIPADSQQPEENISPIQEPEDSYEVTTLTFGGSCTAGSMLGISAYGTFNGTWEEEGSDYFFENLSDLFHEDAFTLTGLNSTFTDRELEHIDEKDTKEWFTAPAAAAQIFSESGVDALSIEFQRTRDYGSEGYGDTEAALDASGVFWCEAVRAAYRELESGVRIGVYCCKLREEDAEGIKSWLANARQKSDFVVLYLSDTGEGYEPDENKKTLLRSYMDAGADLIVGTNSHCLQPAEEYGEGLIAYSLGSLMDGANRYSEEATALLQVDLMSRDGELIGVDYRFLPCTTADGEEPWQPAVITDDIRCRDILAFLAGERLKP